MHDTGNGKLLKRINSCIVIIVGGLLTTAVLSAQMLHFDDTQLRENILQVADHFAREGDWKQAILNYYAFLYQFPDDSEAVSIHWKIVEMYMRSGQHTLAEKNLRQIVEEFRDTPFDLENRQRLALFLYQQQRWEESLRYAYYQPEPSFKIIIAYNLIQMGELELADSVLEEFSSQTGHQISISPAVHDLALKSAKLPGAKKMGAMTLSAILPGSGRYLYREYWSGTVQMAGFGALLGTTLYSILYQPQSVFFCGSVTLVYYFANLYLTHQSGKRYLVNVKAKGIAKISDEYPLERALGLQTMD